jgi:hypothetical protein
MHTTVFIFVQARDLELVSERPLVILTNEASQKGFAVDAEKTKRADQSAMFHQPLPPFWTWFVENPRPTEQRQRQR